MLEIIPIVVVVSIALSSSFWESISLNANHTSQTDNSATINGKRWTKRLIASFSLWSLSSRSIRRSQLFPEKLKIIKARSQTVLNRHFHSNWNCWLHVCVCLCLRLSLSVCICVSVCVCWFFIFSALWYGIVPCRCFNCYFPFRFLCILHIFAQNRFRLPVFFRF